MTIDDYSVLAKQTEIFVDHCLALPVVTSHIYNMVGHNIFKLENGRGQDET